MNKTKNIIVCSILTLIGLSLIFVNHDEVEAIDTRIQDNSSQLSYDSSVYSEEVEYIKHCLNRLEFKNFKGKALYVNGYFDTDAEFALSSFLNSQGFKSFTEQSKDTLFEQAESSVDYNLGFSLSNDNLSSTAFIYSNISNLDDNNDPFYSMEILSNLKNIITVRPGQMSYSSKKVIDYIKANTNIFGYVNLGPNNPDSKKKDWIMADLSEVKSQIDEIADADWYGVFIDQFGYDWGETRERQNIIIDYAHDKGLSVMANSWFSEDALSSDIDISANPIGIESSLSSNDWYLIESFFTDGNSYRSDSAYLERYLKTKEYSEKTGVKISTLSYKRNADTWEDSLSDIEISYVLAHVLGFDGWWFGKYDNSNEFVYGKRPNIDLGLLVKPLALESENKYVAETENYIIEYFSDKSPNLNLIKKNDY